MPFFNHLPSHDEDEGKMLNNNFEWPNMDIQRAKSKEESSLCLLNIKFTFNDVRIDHVLPPMIPMTIGVMDFEAVASCVILSAAKNLPPVALRFSHDNEDIRASGCVGRPCCLSSSVVDSSPSAQSDM